MPGDSIRSQIKSKCNAVVCTTTGGGLGQTAEQLEKMVRIAKEHGLEPATPDEARKILDLKGLD